MNDSERTTTSARGAVRLKHMRTVVCNGDCRGATVSCLAGAVFCHCAILWRMKDE